MFGLKYLANAFDSRMPSFGSLSLSSVLLPLVLLSALLCTSFLSGCSSNRLERNLMPAPAVATVGSTPIKVPDSMPAPAAPAKDSGNTERNGITANEIKIGSCCALTGPAALLGTDLISGALTYLNYINEQGGVYGRKIKLLTYDDGYEPARAFTCFNHLLKDHVFAGAFFVGTPLAARYVPMAELNAIPLVGLYTGAELLHIPFKPHVISIRASYFDETRAQVDNLWAGGHKRIAVIYQNDAFGASVLKGIKLSLSRHHAEPVALGSFDRNTLNINEAIDQVHDEQPDAVIMAGSYAPLSQIVKGSHKRGWKPIFVTVSFVDTDAFIKEAGKDAEGTIITQVVPPYASEDLSSSVLYRRLLKKYYPDRQPTYVSFEGFIDAMVLVDGLQGAGPDLTRSRFIHALETFKNKDIGLGDLKLTFSSSRHKGSSTVYPTVVKDRKVTSLTDWRSVD
jgi:branched-chain amino acid transport system substrate-binding protein